jgi:hypothetical protein
MKKLFNLRTLTMLCVIVFFGLLAAGSDDDSSSSQTSKQPGEKVTITTNTIGCFSKSDEKDVMRMLSHYDGDDTYFNQLIDEGAAINISEGTVVQIVDEAFGMLKVDTTEGAVWIPSCSVN